MTVEIPAPEAGPALTPKQQRTLAIAKWGGLAGVSTMFVGVAIFVFNMPGLGVDDIFWIVGLGLILAGLVFTGVVAIIVRNVRRTAGFEYVIRTDLPG